MEDKEIVTRPLTLEEQRYMEESKARHHENMHIQQVVQGKKFVGPAFIPQPSKIVFEDFTVG
jgi:hypothetical protein